ncbi:MAG: hypothetical protein IKW32_00295 [Bacteroidaceae bacterium]|nr:hypothetical protein [Bacteroidaceae bacterium]
MEKKSTWKEVKGMDVESIIVGVYIFFSALMALFGFGMLSICNALVLILYLFITGMRKDMKELCQGLVEECESEY